MGTTIDRKVVEMRFDNKQFEQNVKVSMSTLDKLKSKLNFKDAFKNLNNIDNAAKKTNLTPLGSAVDALNLKFSALEVMATTALVNITNSAINAGKRIVSALTIDPIRTGFQEYETQINSVQTILANTKSKGTTLDDVNRALDELNLYADKTIYNFTEMTKNIGTFTAAGVELDTSVSAIKGIANLAAVSGSTSQQASTAMYQLSQALAAGKVSLMDWNSVVNAGMGGEIFQEALKDSARVMGTDVDAIIEKYGSFRESLTKGEWLTTDVLTHTLEKFTGDLSDAQLKSMGYTKQQIKSIKEMGTMANDAATKVKTFTQLFDTLKEAAQSGWTSTWELIFGDFEEAKTFFTGLSDTIGGVLGKSADRRNTFLEKVMSSSWKQIGSDIFDAGGSLSDFESITRSIGKEYVPNLDKIIKKTGSFQESLKEGWLTSDILSESLNTYADAALKSGDISKESAKEIKQWAKDAGDTSTEIGKLAENMSRVSGRELLLGSFTNILTAVLKVAGAIRKAMSDIFSISSDRVHGILQAVYDFTKALIPTKDTVEMLKNTFKILFSILGSFASLASTVGQLLLGAFGGALKVVSMLLTNETFGLLNLTAAMGKYMEKALMWVRQHVKLEKAMNIIVDGFNSGLDAIERYINKFKDLPIVQETIAGIAELGKNAFGKFKEYANVAIGGFNDFIITLKTLHELDMLSFDFIWNYIVNSFRTNVIDRFKQMDNPFETIKTSVTTFAEETKDKFNKAAAVVGSFEEKISKVATFIRDKFSFGLGEVLSVAFGAGLIASVLSISKAAKNLDALLEPIVGIMEASKKIVDAIEGTIKKLGGVFDAIASKYKAQAFRERAVGILALAAGVALLAGAIALLANMNQKNVWSAVGAVAALGLIIVGMTAAVGLLTTSAGFVAGAKNVLVLTAALLLLTVALKRIANLDPERLLRNVIVLGALVGALIGVTYFMNKNPVETGGMMLSLITFAVSIRILVGALKQLEGFKIEGLTKKLIALGGLLLALVAVMKVAQFTKIKGSLKTGLDAFGMLAAVISLKILISALKDIADIDASKLLGNLGVIGVVLVTFAAVMTASRLAGSNAFKAGLMLVSMTGSIMMLAIAIRMLGTINPLDCDRAMSSMYKMLGLFALIIAVSSLSGKYSARAGAMLVAMSLSIIVLSGAIMVLSLIDPAGIDRAIGAITKLMVAMSLVVAATHFAGKSGDIKGTMVVIAVTLGILAASLGALSMIKTERLQGATAAISTVMMALALVIAATERVPKKILPTLIALTAAIAVLGGAIYILSKLEPGAAIQAAGGISILLLSLAGAMLVIEGVSAIGKTGLLNLGIMILALGAISAIIVILVKNDASKAIDIAKSLSVLLIMLSAACGILAAVGSFAIPALIGIGIAAAVIVGTVALVNKLSEIDISTMEKGIQIFYKVGECLGAIIGGFTDAMFSGLPAIGGHLSEFSKKAQPFFDIIGGIKADSAKGAKAMAETISILINSNIKDSMTGWLTGGRDIEGFGKDIVTFAGYYKEFADQINGVDGKTVEKSANAAKTLAEFASSIPNSGGLLGSIAGENDIATFAKGLKKFAPAFVEYATCISSADIDMDTVSKSGNAARALAEFASSVPNMGGLASVLAGENTLAAFGRQLKAFGPSFAEYAKSIDPVDAGVVSKSASAGKALAEFAAAIPNTGGLASIFTGDNSLKKFGKELEGFSGYYSKYASNMSGVDSTTLQATATAGKSLVEMKNALPREGFLSGEKSLDDFGEDLEKFGKHFRIFCQGLVSTDTSGVTSAVSSLKKISSNTVSNAIKAFKNVGPDARDYGVDMVKKFGAGIRSQTSSLKSEIINLIDAVLKTIKKQTDKYKSAGKTLVEEFAEGVSDKYETAKSSGKNVVLGFCEGISENTWRAEARAKVMAGLALEAAKKELRERSPSRAMYEIGEYAVVGFANAFRDGYNNVYDVGSNLASYAKNGLSNAIATVADVINSDIDASPTIRPVLDLSDVESGVNTIGSMFSGTNSLSLATDSVGIISTGMNRIQNGPGNGDVIDAIKSLGKDLSNVGGNSYTVNGITYDDGSNIKDAIETIVRAARIERRV